MADKLDGSAIVANTIPSNRIQASSITQTQLQPALYTNIVQATHPKIRSLTYPGNDTAANTGGGDTIVVNGTGFGNTGNVQIYINGNAVSSITVTNANSVSFTAPALSAATYPLYLINTGDGSTAILIPGIQYSGTPTWTTTTPLTTQQADTAWNIQLVATSDSTVSYSLQAGSSLPAGITLAANGLISGTLSSPPVDETTYNFTVVANDLEQQDASRAFSVSVTVAVLDPYVNYTTLLLHCDGTNNANNNAFVDSSNNAYTITRNGNATQGSFTPFSPIGWSNFFDGSGDYLSFTGSSNLTAAGNFTFECWVFVRSIAQTGGSNPRIFNSGSGLTLVLVASTNNLRVDNDSNGTSPISTPNDSIQLNQWMHIAVVRSGSTLTAYLNGINSGSATHSTTFTETGTITIGYTTAGGGTGYLDGYISNMRMVVGTALYTADFTPPTSALTAVANTQLLTCQSNRFIDNSNNAFALTRGGDASIELFSPFNPTAKYSASTHGASAYFDGSGDYLALPNSSISLGSGDCAIEFWCYLTGEPTANPFLFDNYGNSTARLYAYYDGTTMYLHADGTTRTTTFNYNAWNFFQFTRTSGTGGWYLNGSLISTTFSTSGTIDLQRMTIGAAEESGSVNTSQWTKGYISNFRASITNRSTSLPTSPFTSDANTKVLLGFTNAGIIDSIGKNVLETVGDARINTSIKKFGTGSIYFDGTGDYLNTQNILNANLGSGPFTIECWVYFNSVSGTQFILSNYQTSTIGYGLGLSSGTLGFWATGDVPDISTSITPATGIWYHLAVSGQSGAIKMFLNGTQIGSTFTGTPSLDSTNPLRIGDGAGGAVTQPLNGHIDDLRVTKGVARYRYNFTPPTKAFNDGDGNLANNTTDVLVGDQVNLPVFPYTTLLLHGDGTNNANNHAFLDSSNNAFAITRNGNATQGTFSPFSPTGWSAYFDGTGDYLSATSNAAFGMGSGNYTIECWLYLTGTPTYHGIYSTTGTTSSDIQIQLQNRLLRLSSYTAQIAIADSGTEVPLNQWTHVAFCRSGTTVRLFNNGIQVGSATDSITWATGAIQIGQVFALYPLNGYMSNLRVVKGTALYTANFTPPTSALTAIANTSLLTLQSNRFIDNSTNAFTITSNGDTSIQAFSPFAPSVEYTANTHGGSAYFDGTGDWLSAPSDSAFTFGTGDFTIDGWVYILAINDVGIFQQGTSLFPSSATNSVALGINSSGTTWQIYAKNAQAISSATYTLNTWTHFALVRSGTTTTLYINGVSVITVTSDSTNYTGTYFGIGSIYGSNAIRAYISNVRVIKGTAVYTAAFTPPTSPTTAIANTQLLCNFTNAGILDSTGKNVLETVGDARVNTAIKKYGTGSMYFDGTGDGLRQPTVQNLNWSFGSGDMTIECWAYFNSVSGYQTLVDFRASGGTFGASSFVLWVDAGTLSFYAGAYSSGSPVLSGGSISTGQWYHIVISRYGGTTKLFLNGNQTATTTNVWTQTFSATDILSIGATTNITGNYLNGYIDDLRITKGIARYVQNFTPPTAAFLNK